MLRHSPWPLACVAQALWPESHHQGITALFLLLPFLSKERNSYIKTFPGFRHSPALTHQEIASPLSLPTFLPEHSPAQGVASPQKICWCWLTSKQKLPLDKKSHSTIGNLFVLGGAFFLFSFPACNPCHHHPHPQSLHCWLCSFLSFFRGYVEQPIFISFVWVTSLYY